MRRLGSALLVAALVFNLSAISAFAADDDAMVKSQHEYIAPDTSWFDSQNKQTEYTLTTAAQLAGLYEILQDEDFELFENFAGVTIKLGNDIVFNDVSTEDWTDSALEWHSLSGNSATNVFAGTFDGDGHAIIGLYSTEGGLFARVEGGATIKNLTIDTAVINANDSNVGGIAGAANTSSIIDGCTVKNSVINSSNGTIGGIAGRSIQATVKNCRVVDTDVSGSGSVGGISGDCGEVTDCTVDERSDISGGDNVGGITGTIMKSIANCTNSATVSGTGPLGGIAGLYSGGTSVEIKNCTNNGAVGQENANFVGGILGTTTSHGLTILGCVNNALVSGDTNVAGIAGMIYTSTTVKDCESNGSVNGQKNVGGVVGNSSLRGNAYEAGKPNTVSGCTVSATVTGTENVGGLVGNNVVVTDEAKDDTTIQNNILLSSASVSGITNVGALIGSNGTETDTGTVKNNFWPERIGQASGSGAGSSSDTAADSVREYPKVCVNL